MVVTSYGLNKNLDDEIKKQEKANNGLRYRCAAIKQKEIKTKIAKKAAFKICSLIENLFTHQFLSLQLGLTIKPLQTSRPFHYLLQSQSYMRRGIGY